MFKVILWGGCYYYPHLEGEKIDHKEFHYLAQDHTVRKWQRTLKFGVRQQSQVTRMPRSSVTVMTFTHWREY